MSEIIILGRGRLGRSLAGALIAAGDAPQLLSGRDGAVSLTLARPVPGALVILAVPDQNITGLAEQLARLDWHAELCFVHVSGAQGLAALQRLAESGHAVGCFHPLQPFPTERGPEAFLGCVCSIDAGSPVLYARLEKLARTLGAIPKRMPDRWRPLYHAAALMSSSYIVVLAAHATAMLSAAGWSAEESMQALLPLMQGTIDNLSVQGLPNGLNGPMRRGDTATVARHLLAIREATPPAAYDAEGVYRQLARGALRLAAEAGLSADDISAMEEVLRDEPVVPNKVGAPVANTVDGTPSSVKATPA